MRHTPRTFRTVFFRMACFSLWSVAIGAAPAVAHELWIETSPNGQTGVDHEIAIYWGHEGERVGGPPLAAMANQLSAIVIAPDGRATPLRLAARKDCYASKTSLDAGGFHAVGAVLETGIIDREVHGIPANTRIIMYGQALVRANQGEAGLSNTPGFDLEIALPTDPDDLRPGRLVAAKVLFKGKPLGGRNALVSLGTAGPRPRAEASEADARQWVIQAHANPKTGEVHFPLVAAGRHIFLIRYLDETPGRYEGDLDFGSDFSHLHKGDAYERTMYVATLAIDVKGG